MDEELLSKGFESVDSLDERIAQLRRLLAEEEALRPNEPHRIDETRPPASPNNIHETELAELLELRRHLTPQNHVPLLPEQSKFDSAAWLGWLVVAVIAGAVYYFLFK